VRAVAGSISITTAGRKRSADGAPHFGTLDSLRGLAAISVVFYHIYWPNPFYALGYVRNSYLMVDVFFVLSGFVIYYAYRNKIATSAQFQHFAWLRFWRLYPVHIVFLMVFVAIECLRYFMQRHYGLLADTPAFNTNNLYSFLTNLALVQSFNLHDRLTYNYPSWSISAEFCAYFVFAAVVFFGSKTRRIIAAAAVIAAAGFVSLLLLGRTLEALTFEFGPVRCLTGFFLGAVMYPLYGLLSRTRFVTAHRTWVGAAALAAMLLFFVGAAVKPPNAWDLTIYRTHPA
jgi:peptidoglycan/LPS O-acetylase OafA/YrhL